MLNYFKKEIQPLIDELDTLNGIKKIEVLDLYRDYEDLSNGFIKFLHRRFLPRLEDNTPF